MSCSETIFWWTKKRSQHSNGLQFQANNSKSGTCAQRDVLISKSLTKLKRIKRHRSQRQCVTTLAFQNLSQLISKLNSNLETNCYKNVQRIITWPPYKANNRSSLDTTMKLQTRFHNRRLMAKMSVHKSFSKWIRVATIKAACKCEKKIQRRPTRPSPETNGTDNSMELERKTAAAALVSCWLTKEKFDHFPGCTVASSGHEIVDKLFKFSSKKLINLIQI